MLRTKLRHDDRIARPGGALTQTISIELASWLVQDGYPEVEVGSTHRFALRFSRARVDDLVGTDESTVGMTHLGGAEYRVTARIAHLHREPWPNQAWVIDFGLPAYVDNVFPDWAAVGLNVTGNVHLGVGFFPDRLARLPSMPRLSRDWRIERMQLETTPWEPCSRIRQGAVQHGFRRQRGPRTFVDVSGTDAWRDDEGRARYVLDCTLRD